MSSAHGPSYQGDQAVNMLVSAIFFCWALGRFCWKESIGKDVEASKVESPKAHPV